ncbi:clan AA aspartic protease [Nostoc sp. UCD121]|uniref:clan AA aspartic protease n=1 Tax=unclassified Nostoc TaxID=2593658 RepID=UPI001623A34C|nr:MULTISPECIES: clan AA aspartic protease [unclassified Nostoc]MBC1225122.1 clan AA aspartic protease [Nostoc sp. UCD120]MBC1280411.1 clan AA aspartic protease [Nostoc sp. UCD121]MBC1295286.1 clan AA aspartic protease [Nostoc sp. UCD122]
MISGIVKDAHPTVNVEFRLPNLPDFTIEFVIDTGFTDYLCLPPEAVALLNLSFRYELPANLADNSWVDIPVHEAVIIWNGEERVVNVLATGKRPLLGTALLDGYELVIQFIEGGLVTIDEL